MKLPKRFLLPTAAASLFIGLWGGFSAQVGAEPVQDGAVSAELIAENQSIQPGKPFHAALRLKIDPTWHTYWLNSGDAGKPTTLDLELPEGFSAGPLQFPAPKKFIVDYGFDVRLGGFGYETEVIHPILITPPDDLKPGSVIDLKGKAGWLMCDPNTCIPGSAEIGLTLTVAESAQPSPDAPSVQAAVKKVPADRDWKTAISDKIDKLEVTIAAPEEVRANANGARFFPLTQPAFNLLEEPAVAIEDGSLRITAPPDKKLKELPEVFEGVLLMKDGTSFRVSTAAEPSGNLEQEAPADAVAESPASAETQGVVQKNESLPFGGGLFGILLAGFIGGIILNIMPCVFPVISLKIFSFVSQAKEDPKKILMHGIIFALGVLTFFWVLAGLLIVVKSGWGAVQFQNPLFNIGMAALMIVLALSLFGVFEFGARLTSVGGELTQASGYGGSFWSGALATLLATPCTGPFLGITIGWAFTQPPAITLLFFTIMGLGMSAPYLVLSAFPKLLGFLPRPGAWMETFKQAMGFPMLAAAVWLFWVLADQIGTTGLAWLMIGMILLSIAFWSFGRFVTPGSTSRSKISGKIVAAVFIAGAVGMSLFASNHQPENSASAGTAESGIITTRGEGIAELIAEQRAAGKHVFVDFTAKWCLICQANKPTMHSETVLKAFADHNVVFVVADWTNYNDEILEFLKKYGRQGVPFYPLFPADQSKEPLILPQLLSHDVILSHLEKLDAAEKVAADLSQTP